MHTAVVKQFTSDQALGGTECIASDTPPVLLHPAFGRKHNTTTATNRREAGFDFLVVSRHRVATVGPETFGGTEHFHTVSCILSTRVKSEVDQHGIVAVGTKHAHFNSNIRHQHGQRGLLWVGKVEVTTARPNVLLKLYIWSTQTRKNTK